MNIVGVAALSCRIRTGWWNVLLLACALLVSGCGRDDDHRYPEQVRTSYIASCIQAGSERQYCECTLDELEKMMSYQEFQELEQGIISGERAAMDKMSLVMDSVTAYCGI